MLILDGNILALACGFSSILCLIFAITVILGPNINRVPKGCPMLT